MRTLKFPKPVAQGPKPRKRIERGRPPRGMSPAKYGSFRQKVKYANDLWRKLIYAKEPSGVCPRCRKRAWHDAAHCFIKGKYRRLRFDIDNGAPLCRPCHREIDSDHLAKQVFFAQYMGAARYEALTLRALTRGKLDIDMTIIALEAAYA